MVGSRVDCVLPGESVPCALSIPDQRVPPSSDRVVDFGDTSLFRDVRSGQLCEKTAH